MAQKITLKVQRFDKDKFNETVDTNFSQLINVPDPSLIKFKFATINDEIQALLDEIAGLRKENLNLIKEATNLDNAIDKNNIIDKSTLGENAINNDSRTR